MVSYQKKKKTKKTSFDVAGVGGNSCIIFIGSVTLILIMLNMIFRSYNFLFLSAGVLCLWLYAAGISDPHYCYYLCHDCRDVLPAQC